MGNSSNCSLGVRAGLYAVYVRLHVRVGIEKHIEIAYACRFLHACFPAGAHTYECIYYAYLLAPMAWGYKCARACACVTPTTGASLEPEAPAQCHTEIPRIGAGLLGGAPANLAGSHDDLAITNW